MRKKVVFRRRKNFVPKSAKKVTTAAQVAKIARAVTLRTSETKSYYSTYTTSPLDDNYVAQNLIYPISQGAGSENIVGEKMFLKNIRLKGFMQINQPNATTTTRCARIIVFATKKQLTNSQTIITDTDLVRTGGASSSLCEHVDLHKVDLLYDNTWTLTQNLANQIETIPFNINIPINKTVYFDADNSGYLKNKNYYVAFCGRDGGLTSNPVLFVHNYAVNFKDE